MRTFFERIIKLFGFGKKTVSNSYDGYYRVHELRQLAYDQLPEFVEWCRKVD